MSSTTDPQPYTQHLCAPESFKRFNRAVQSDDSQKTLIEEVNQLYKKTLDLEELFLKVSNDLDFPVDNVSVETKQGLNNLQTAWKEHTQFYSLLLWRSRSVAGSAATTCDDFVDNFLQFLSDPEVPLQSKKDETNAYSQIMLSHEKNSQDLSQQFKALRDRVDDFSINWEGLINKHSQQPLTDRITSLGKTLKTIDSEIRSLEKKVNCVAPPLGGDKIIDHGLRYNGRSLARELTLGFQSSREVSAL
ncbi:hypothetical protein C8Q75DRAFT_360400 [Abortiporus biennis]|nr:hypothetical protein C8Q75DRAFT_360400 [Abortiporus biennis]